MSHEAVKEAITEALKRTRSPNRRKDLQEALSYLDSDTVRPSVEYSRVVPPESEEDLTDFYRQKREIHDKQIEKYGKPFPDVLARVTLKNDRTTPQRPGWWVGSSNEEKDEIYIWKPVYSGGGAYPTHEDGHGVVNRTVKIKDIASVY